MAFKKFILLVALVVATMATTNASNLIDTSSFEDDDMVAPSVDFDSFSEDLEELGPGDEYLMDAIFEHRELKVKGNGKLKADSASDSPGLGGKKKTANDIAGEGGGKNRTKFGKNATKDSDNLESDADGFGRNVTKLDGGNSTKDKMEGGLDGKGKNRTKDGPPGRKGKDKAKGAGLDDLDDLGGKGTNRTKTDKGNSTKDGPPDRKGKDKAKGGLDDLGGEGKNRTNADKGNSTKDGSPGRKGKDKAKGGLDDLGGKGKNRTKAEKGNSPPGRGGKNKTKNAIKTKVDSKGKPLWWDTVKVNYTKTKGTRLKRCSKRKKPPMDGDKCSKKNKTCYFGNQVCPGELDFPSLKCDCVNRVWNCETKSCAACPVIRPVTNERCSIESLSCDYGEDVQCCGNAFPESTCKCNGGLWKCDASTQCIFPTCITETWNVVNTTCARARRKVLADYPGMNVQCVAEGTPTSKIDINRVQIFVDDKNRAVANPVVG